MDEKLDEKEEILKNRLAQLDKMEQELLDKEKALKAKQKALKESEKSKKQILLRLAPGLWEDLAEWAEDDFRSINGQIEYLLSECVRNRKKK